MGLVNLALALMQYTLNENDIINAFRLHAGKRAIAISLVTGFVVLAVIFVKNGTDFSSITPLMIMFSLSSLLFLFVEKKLSKLRARKQLSEDKELSGDITIKINGREITFTTQFSSSTYPRTFFRKIKMDNRVILLYKSNVQFYIIPRNILDANQTLLEWINTG
jgi:hypothetical protein